MGKNDVKKYFGAAVRLRRDHLGISQEELAGRAGLHRTYISDIERGARNVSLESIAKLAQALGSSISGLFSPEGDLSGPAGPGAERVTEQCVDILLVEDDPRDLELTL